MYRIRVTFVMVCNAKRVMMGSFWTVKEHSHLLSLCMDDFSVYCLHHKKLFQIDLKLNYFFQNIWKFKK